MRASNSSRCTRLGQEVVGPCFDALDAVLHLSQRRHDDDGYKPRVGIIFENFADFEAIHDRHHDVQEDEVRPFLLHLCNASSPLKAFTTS